MLPYIHYYPEHISTCVVEKALNRATLATSVTQNRLLSYSNETSAFTNKMHAAQYTIYARCLFKVVTFCIQGGALSVYELNYTALTQALMHTVTVRVWTSTPLLINIT